MNVCIHRSASALAPLPMHEILYLNVCLWKRRSFLQQEGLGKVDLKDLSRGDFITPPGYQVSSSEESRRKHGTALTERLTLAQIDDLFGEAIQIMIVLQQLADKSFEARGLGAECCRAWASRDRRSGRVL